MPGSLPTKAADQALLQRVAILHVALTFTVGAALMMRSNASWLVLAAFQTPAIAIDAVAWLLGRGGRVKAGAWLMTANLTLRALAAPLYLGGLSSHTVMPVASGVLLAGVLIGWRPALAVAAGVSLITLAYAVAQDMGVLTPGDDMLTGFDAFVAIAGTLGMCVLLVYQSVRTLREALAQAQQREAERDEATRRFLTTQKMELVGRLASGIAHDFNNLLAVVRGGTEYIELTQPKSDDLGATLRDIDGATERGTLLTRQLLALGRARVDEEAQVLNLAAVVKAQAALLPRLLGSRIRVTCDASGEVWVPATAAGLEQIVLNLVVNARDAMPEGGALTLSVKQEGGRAWLVVRDTGVGMSEETRARLFEPFFTTRATGTGLGLATVHELVTRLDGSIGVQSALGEGACFTISLPLAAAPASQELCAPAQTPTVKPRRVLLVEDNDLVRRQLSKLMQASGLDVTAVNGGDEALALLGTARSVDAVITDVSMPYMTGDELAAAMQEKGFAVPVIFISSNGPPQHLPDQAVFLRKPVTMAQLSAALDRLCGDK